MIVLLLVVHGLLAVALLGAITHQAFAVWRRQSGPVPQSFIGQFSGVDPKAYVSAVVLLFLTTSIGGAMLYPQYRLDVRPTLEDLQYRAANGVFEIKEHLAAIGLGILPAYVVLWTRTPANVHATTRACLTWILAFVVWWSFLIGHVLNNIKGLVP